MLRIFVLIVAVMLTACGPRGLQGPPGPKGDIGVQGPKGDPGEDGQGCIVVANDLGALISCGSASVQINNGTPGTSITTAAFCPDLGGGIGFKEFGLQIGPDLYAVYYDGTHTFLTKLLPGNYVTTDGRNCHFTI